MRRYVGLIALGFILLLGGALRLYHLSTVPTELIVDEIDLYNSAHSIATTGHDIDGTLLPFLDSQITRNPPVYAIAGYTSTLLFGKTPLGWRLPAVIFGLAAILLVYAIALELTRRRSIALIAALLMATQPIFIQFSRIGWEPSSELPFLLGGVYALLRSFRRDDHVSLRWLCTGSVLLALTCYTYMAGWFYAVLLGAAVLTLNGLRLRSPRVAAGVAAACVAWFVIAAPALWMWFLDPHTIARTQRIATFSHGVSLESLRIFAANYLAHFRWSYLVTTGDPQSGVTWRYLNGFGAFFWFVIPLSAAGLMFASRYVHRESMLAFVWIWLFAYPLGGALTNEGAPNAPRTLAGAPVFCILAAIGLAYLVERAPRWAKGVVAAAFATASALALTTFCIFYFTQYVHVNSNAWDSGTRAMFADVRSREASFDRVCFAVRPAWYGIDTYVRFYLEGVPLQTFDTLDSAECSLPGTLLVTDREHAVKRPGFSTLATIPDVDGANFATVSGRPRTATPAAVLRAARTKN